MHDFLSDNNLFSSNKSAFRSGNSCINLSVTHEILKMYLIKEYDKRNVEVRGILFDIPKAFEKMWHDRLILSQNGISGYNILRDFLRNRKQRVLLNVKKLLARNGMGIWSLGSYNRNQCLSHLFRKQTLNHLAPLETHKIHLPFSCKNWTSTKIISLELPGKLWLYPNKKI